MVSEKNIFRTAQATIRKCGKRYDPLDFAFDQVEHLHRKDDAEGAATWMRIADAIGVLLSNKPDKLH